MPDLSTILSSLGLNAALLWLTKNWISERLKNAIKHEYDEKLETHKALLQCESTKEIERLKGQLQIAAAERGVRYARIFEITAETLANVYSKLLELQEAVLRYTEPMEGSQSKSELERALMEKAKSFREYYVPRQIYVDSETRARIAKHFNLLDHLARRFAFTLKAGPENPNWEKWNAQIVSLVDEIPQLQRMLEDQFQWVLGLQEKAPTSQGTPSVQSNPKT